jgi:flagellar motor protein MotB
MRFFSFKTVFYCSILTLFIFTQKTYAQDFKKKFIDAEYHFLYEEFSDALPIYLELIKMDPENANINYRTGICYLHVPNPNENAKALPYLLKAISNINPKYKEGSYQEKGAPKDALFYLGNAYRNVLNFDSAEVAYKKYRDILSVKDIFYIDYIDREIQCTRNAKELVRLPLKLITENLGQTINSPTKVENCPVISDDENVLVFTAGDKNVFSPEIDINVINYDYQMDNIYFSKKVDGRWTDPENITKDIGAATRTVPVTISADGTELYLVRDDNDNGNIYVSNYKNNKWSQMKALNKNINTKQWESHATLTKNGKTLYFTSDRSGGYGGLDIYRSDRDESGEWGPAVNIGPTINTKYDEETPFILNDSKTMYFSSQGHYSMGGFDVFHTTLLDNNTWSTPLNIGYPINTVGNDLFYMPKANGEYAFFPLNNNERGIGSNDIFRIAVSIPETDSTEIELKGKITLLDQNNELPHDFLISVIDSIKGDTTVKFAPDFAASTYSTIIRSGSFKIEYKCGGYLTHYEYLYIPVVYTRTEIVIDVEMTPIEVSKGEYYVIRSIFFDYGKFDLRRESEVELQRLADLMQKNPSLLVEIVGHTDALGSVKFNQKLSENRSKSAIDYLVSLGIDQNRFVSKGMGKNDFIAINQNPDGSDNPEGRQLNRRVEIKLLNAAPENIIVEEIKVPESLRFYRDGRQRPAEKYTILLVKQSEKLVSSDNASRLINLTATLKKTEKYANSTVSPITETKVDDMIIYTTGEYNNKSDAMKELNLVIDEGFPEASLVSMDEIGVLKKEINLSYSQNQALNSNNEETTYTIQLKALTKPADPSFIKSMKGIVENYCQDGIYRYTFGEYKGHTEAQTELQKLIEQGYTDAFIVKADGFKQKVETKGDFTIQLKSLKSPVNLSYFKDLKGVKELIGNDGNYKYLYGTFATIDDARKELKKLQKITGYEDIFIINTEKFK